MRYKIFSQVLHHPSPQWKTCICRFFYLHLRCDFYQVQFPEKTV